jgi:DNA primase small subunit
MAAQVNHLLKSTLVVHPGIGRACIPINPKKAEDFDPPGVQTVTGISEHGHGRQ